MRPGFKVSLDHLECMVFVFGFFDNLAVVSRNYRVGCNHNINVRLGLSKLPHFVVKLLPAGFYNIVYASGEVSLW